MTRILAGRFFLIIAAPLVLAACAMASHQDDDAIDPKDSFMDAWRIYSHCLASNEPEVLVSDLHVLTQFANTVARSNSIRPSRLAVDPTAMVSAFLADRDDPRSRS